MVGKEGGRREGGRKEGREGGKGMVKGRSGEEVNI